MPLQKALDKGRALRHVMAVEFDENDIDAPLRLDLRQRILAGSDTGSNTTSMVEPAAFCNQLW